MVRPFRFGITHARADSASDWEAFVRKADSDGFSTLMVADHLSAMDPFVALAAATRLAPNMRLGTFVVNNDFLNPALLARSSATVDLLSDGRFELGLGAGWNEPEYVSSGIPFDPGATRIRRLDEALSILARLFAGERVTFRGNHYDLVDHVLDPLPPQGAGLPILVGGNGDRLLKVAAAHASIIGLTGFRITADEVRWTHASIEAVAERVGYVSGLAGPRADGLEWNVLVQRCVVTPDRTAAATDLSAEFALSGTHIEPDILLDTPFVLLGTVGEIVEQLQAIRQSTGISYVSIHARAAAGFDEVVRQLSGL